MPANPNPSRPNLLLLALGDALALLIVTLVGFASHELRLTNLRWLSTFIPLCVSWAVLSPWFGAYTPAVFTSYRKLWRIPLAMALAGPMVAWLRGLWLGAAISPVFVAIIAASSAFGITLWRLLWLVGSKNKANVWTNKN